MSKLSKGHMPGWVSHGPVQINVGRDLHIHRGFDPDNTPQHDVGTRVAGATARVGTALWYSARALFYLGWGLLSLVAWLTFSVYAIGLWLVGRLGDFLKGVESVQGGSARRLVYVPSVLQRNEVLPALTACERFDELKQLESDYDHAN